MTTALNEMDVKRNVYNIITHIADRSKENQQAVIAGVLKTIMSRMPKPERGPFLKDILQEVHGDLKWIRE